MSPVNATYFGISGYLIFWVVFVIAIGLFSFRIYQLTRYMFLGRRTESYTQMAKRAFTTAVEVLGQWGQLKNLNLKDRASIGHAFMAWGFFIFVLFYFIFIILGAGFGLSEKLEHTQFFFYYAWVMDIAALFVIAGAAWGIVRRYIIRPSRLEGEQSVEAMVILVSVIIHPVTHLFKEATSIALNHPPAGLGTFLPPVSSALNNVFNNSPVSAIETAGMWFFWAHWLVVLFILVYIGYSRYLHVLASIFNILFQSAPPKGALQPVDLENVTGVGSGNITDFTWKQLLDLYSCVSCGQCQELCPATASGKPLNPKAFIQDLKDHLLDTGPELLKTRKQDDIAGVESEEESTGNLGDTLVDSVITEDEIWACTTCRACDDICPVLVEHVDKIVDLRRNLVLMQAKFPSKIKQFYKNIEENSNPWGKAWVHRANWSGGLNIPAPSIESNIDTIYWAGCLGAYYERIQRVSLSLCRLLRTAGISFTVLGKAEKCCGDAVRRTGNEYLFRQLAQQNIDTFEKYHVKRIITHCPHCYNVFKNEYPRFGGHYEVVHHTRLIADLMLRGIIPAPDKQINKSLVYHDPCYLGRYNDIYVDPRQVLKTVPGLALVEKNPCMENAFCCGAGGGGMWMTETGEQRISQILLDQVMEKKPEILATACPYCLTMLEDESREKAPPNSLAVLDIVEILQSVLPDKIS